MIRHVVRKHVRKAVVVTLDTGETFSGVLFDADADAWILRNASVVSSPDQAEVPADGEVLILRGRISYAQFV